MIFYYEKHTKFFLGDLCAFARKVLMFMDEY